MQQEIIFNDEPRARFPFGQIIVTPGVFSQIPDDEIIFALSRHLRGDWGTLDPEDVKANEKALFHGGRLFSGYHSIQNLRFWIITEADRSRTTVLFPGEY